MAEAAAENVNPNITDKTRWLIRAHAAAADNVAVFFGEDIFVAMGSNLLIKGFLESNGIIVQSLQLAKWAVPTAMMALFIHASRLILLDRRLRMRAGAGK